LRGQWSTPDGYKDDYQEYSLTVSLTANQASEGNIIKVDGSGCFFWRLTGIVQRSEDGQGAAWFRFRDVRGRYMSASPIRVGTWGAGTQSIPVLPFYVIGPGLQVFLDLYERAGFPCDVNVCLRGFRRKKVVQVEGVAA
jgi:hypothetical protein